MDLQLLQSLLLSIAEDNWGNLPAQFATLRDQVNSERFKVKGVYENVLQGWVTVIMIQLTWGKIPNLQMAMNICGFLLGFGSIWANALSFWKWHGTGGHIWKVSAYVHMIYAMVVSGGSLVRLVMIPFCGPDHIFRLAGMSCMPLSCRHA